MRYILTIVILALLPFALTAINANAGEYGFQFLQIPVSPVASALGGTGIYATGYAGAFIQNPAANLLEERFSLSLQHNIWIVDTSTSQLVYSNSNRNRHFGLVGRMLDYGELENRDDTGLLIGKYHPLDANLMANYALRIMPDHLLGINAGLIYEKLDTASSFGLSADLGYVYLTPVTNAILFTSVRNIGFTSKMDDESIKLPLTIEAGLGYTIPELAFADRISQQLTFKKAVDNDLTAAYAAEISLWQILALRLGYKFLHDEEGITAGLGINWHNLEIDYGWTSFSDRLNDSHSFGITYNF